MTKKAFSGFADLEKTGWSNPAIAQSYATGFAQASGQCIDAMVALVWAGHGCHALDLCCGQGIVSAGLHRANAQVVGLDFSAAMLEIARATVPNVEFVEGDAMDLPFEDHSFDAVTIGFGLLHVPDPLQVLVEARRVLRPGGRLAYSIWQAPTGPSALGYVFKAIVEHGAANVALPEGPGMHDYSFPDIAFPALAQAGFSDPEQVVVRASIVIEKPDEPVDLFLNGTVRGSALLQGQPDKNMSAIRIAVATDVIQNHGDVGPWDVPIPAVITAATAA
ncbi:MAG: methyltransferase domain-containing protein [Paracoccaceae bacterium]